MGDKHIYDIIGLYLPEHLKSSMNTVRFITRQNNFDIIVDALEKYFHDMGINSNDSPGGKNDSLPDNSKTMDQEGFHCQYRKVKL